MTINSVVNSIQPLDSNLLAQAQDRLDQLTKPQGSLGELENIAKRLFAIYGTLDRSIVSKAVFVLAGDHGIVEEGVSAYPKEVTREMLRNFQEGGAAICVLARHVGARLFVSDFGVGTGTRNFLHEDAMTREETLNAITRGHDFLIEMNQKYSFDLAALGEMGIGNSTSASAMISALTHHSPEQVTGRGTGVAEESLRKKISVIEKAIEARRPDPKDPIDVLSKLGGYEIAGLVGIYLACASLRIPCVIDGLISGAAALAAFRMKPPSKDYFFASHQSREPGHRVVLKELGLRPIIDASLCLGEGSGAALALPLIENAWALFREMATFQSAGVSSKI